MRSAHLEFFHGGSGALNLFEKSDVYASPIYCRPRNKFIVRLLPVHPKNANSVFGGFFIFSTIAQLLFCGGPSTVFFRISKRSIYSVQRLASRFFSHVGEKRLKALPLFAHVNTACSIQLVACCLWVFAPLVHGHPQVINTGLTHSVEGSHMQNYTTGSIA